MPQLNELKERVAAKVAEMRSLNEKAVNDKRDLNPAEKKQWKSLDAEHRSLAGQVERAERLANLERLEHATPVSGNSGAMDLRSYSVAKALRESMNGNLSGLEAEYHAEHSRGREVRGALMPTEVLLSEQRALTTTTPTGGVGGNLVATNLAPLQDRNRSMLKTEQMGATVMRGLTGNLELPNVTESGTAHWIAEHTDTTRSDMKFAKIGMGPKTVSGEYEISRRMLLQSDTAIESLLRGDLGYLLAQALDSAAIRGGGVNEPTGILNTAGVATIPGYTLPSELSDVAADMMAALELDDVTGSAAFMTNPAVMNIARKVQNTNGNNIPLSEIFHNMRVESTTQVPKDIGAGNDKNALIYGHWASLVIGYWSAVDILVNPYHADVASKGGALIHAFLDCDVAVRQPQAFCFAEI